MIFWKRQNYKDRKGWGSGVGGGRVGRVGGGEEFKGGGGGGGGGGGCRGMGWGEGFTPYQGHKELGLGG